MAYTYIGKLVINARKSVRLTQKAISHKMK